ncbi:universal stress protein [Luteibacter sp.]|uniref:universal stress protein n=1 Tax=Luteibacter sp. TaxID=1886636 RepID=UPI003C32CF23
MRILIAVDGSAISTRAVRFILQQWPDGPDAPEITLINVDMPLSAHVEGYLDAMAVAKFHMANVARAMRSARRLLRGHRNHQEITVVGDPGEEIVRAALKHRAQLIAMGSRGHGALGSLVLGSVVLKVLAHSRIPVLVVR